MIAIVSIPLHFHWQEALFRCFGLCFGLPARSPRQVPSSTAQSFYLRTKGANRNRTSPHEPGLPAWSCSSPTNQCSGATSTCPGPAHFPKLPGIKAYTEVASTQETRERLYREAGEPWELSRECYGCGGANEHYCLWPPPPP